MGKTGQRIALTLALVLASTPALAEEPERAPGALERADVSSAYAGDPLMDRARRHGLGQEVLRVIDEPETPNDMRVAFIDAAARSGKTSGMAKLYARVLRRRLERAKKPLTLDSLATHELLALGTMLAHDDPTGLKGLGGEAEFERATPMVMLTAAVSRQRGDMAAHLVNALVKAQHASVSPADALCEPHACLENAMAPFGREWSVRPEAVCAARAAVSSTKASAKGKLADACALLESKHARAPFYTYEPPSDARAQAQAQPGRFSRPTASSNQQKLQQLFGGANGKGLVLAPGMPPIQIPPNATQEQVERLLEQAMIDEVKRQDPMMGAMLEQAIKMQRAQGGRTMGGSRPFLIPRPTTTRGRRQTTRATTPQTITVDPDADTDTDADTSDDGFEAIEVIE